MEEIQEEISDLPAIMSPITEVLELIIKTIFKEITEYDPSISPICKTPESMNMSQSESWFEEVDEEFPVRFQKENRKTGDRS